MKIEHLYKYYSFGYDYRILRSLTHPVSNSEIFKFLSSYFTFIDSLNLTVTKSGISLKKLQEDFEQLSKLANSNDTKDKTIEIKLYQSITKKIEEIDNILDAELLTKDGYILDSKRYSNEILTSGMDKLFAKGVYEKIPEIAQYDFKEAGLCLAFDRYTASAFHVLRGTESVLKAYFLRLFPKITKSPKTWGGILQKINDKIKTKSIKPSPPEELMINLENLRKYYRNETQHPSKKYTSDEVQDLIPMCIKTINELLKDLEVRGIISPPTS